MPLTTKLNQLLRLREKMGRREENNANPKTAKTLVSTDGKYHKAKKLGGTR